MTDNLGIKQSYGVEERQNGMHVQWLTTGAGIQHEETWDVSEPDDNNKGGITALDVTSSLKSQELFQIWLNRSKMFVTAKRTAVRKIIYCR